MNRCSPVQMRIALEAVEVLKRAGLNFVPIPVIDDADFIEKQLMMIKALDKLIKESE